MEMAGSMKPSLSVSVELYTMTSAARIIHPPITEPIARSFSRHQFTPDSLGQFCLGIFRRNAATKAALLLLARATR